MNYQPKAGRCRACTKLWEDCSALPFHTMPVHSHDGTDAVVICSEYVKADGPAPRNEPRRIYLSGPMTGLPEFNYPAFHAEAARLRALGYHVENPAENPAQDSWEAYMAVCIPQMATCDTIALLPGWSESRGALRERQEAVRLRMMIMPAAKIIEPTNGKMAEKANGMPIGMPEFQETAPAQ
ncbi:DUF4406 domain-containing protein [Pseudomonas sp. C11]|uniref:DUF4406 domain-containing protein n=1 Tax=Pseudomonas sp. C11 TaxID=3075550 RepID=UPI002AFEAB3E|nr:DUF4406 domain-containing protein [Pseudomonas sp. C11]